jgi:hypothetical protein
MLEEAGRCRRGLFQLR